MDDPRLFPYPRGITREQIEETRIAFQPYYKEPLTDDDCLEIILNMYGLFDILEEIDDKERASRSTT